MLTQEEWNKISIQASSIYNQLELEIIEEIAKRIANVGYANTVVKNDIKIAQEMRNIISRHNKFGSTIQQYFSSSNSRNI